MQSKDIKIKMRVAIIGACGHGQMVISAKDAEIIGVCPSFLGEDVSGVLKNVTEAGNSVELFSSYTEMVERTNLDILVVDGIFNRHFEMALYGLENNINVFCEKPVAFTSTECEKLKIAEKKSTGTLWTMQTWRYEKTLFTAKKIIDQGTIGEIRMLNGQKSYKMGVRPDFYKDSALYGGTIPWVAIHAIDAVRFLCNKKLLNVYSQKSHRENNGNGTMETTTASVFFMEDEVIATVTADYYRPQSAPTHGDDRIRVVGTKGVLEIINENVYVINDSNTGKSPVELLTPPNFFEDFIATLMGSSKGLIDFEDSVASTLWAIKANESAIKNCI